LLVLCGTCLLEADLRRVLLGTICGIDKARVRGVLVFDITRMGIVLVVGRKDMTIS
jgi:hypothetical protein